MIDADDYRNFRARRDAILAKLRKEIKDPLVATIKDGAEDLAVDFIRDKAEDAIVDVMDEVMPTRERGPIKRLLRKIGRWFVRITK